MSEKNSQQTCTINNVKSPVLFMKSPMPTCIRHSFNNNNNLLHKYTWNQDYMKNFVFFLKPEDFLYLQRLFVDKKFIEESLNHTMHRPL